MDLVLHIDLRAVNNWPVALRWHVDTLTSERAQLLRHLSTVTVVLDAPKAVDMEPLRASFVGLEAALKSYASPASFHLVVNVDGDGSVCCGSPQLWELAWRSDDAAGGVDAAHRVALYVTASSDGSVHHGTFHAVSSRWRDVIETLSANSDVDRVAWEFTGYGVAHRGMEWLRQSYVRTLVRPAMDGRDASRVVWDASWTARTRRLVRDSVEELRAVQAVYRGANATLRLQGIDVEEMCGPGGAASAGECHTWDGKVTRACSSPVVAGCYVGSVAAWSMCDDQLTSSRSGGCFHDGDPRLGRSFKDIDPTYEWNR
jgi:hypothetical protein